MSHRRLTTVVPAVLVSLVLLLAACTAEEGASSAPAEESTPPESSAPATESEAPSMAEPSASAAGDAAVLVADSDHGEILTDADGLTIYFFANDTEGSSSCEGECLANWPPVEAEGTPTGGEGVTAELGTIERSDGSTQLSVNGFPAYYFAGDSAAGDTNGQGQGDVWWVFGADGEPIEE
jgi:predicted lipoprotein with Yx(FWY)xxD motif